MSKRGWILGGVWIVTLGVAFGAGALGYRHRAQIRAWLGAAGETSVVQTNLYNLRLESVATPGAGRNGAIAPLGDGILVAYGNGSLWLVDAGRSLTGLEARVPLNLSEFASDPFTQDVMNPDNFAVKDLLVRPTAAGVRILASHLYWNSEGRCNTMRVSSLETSIEALRSGSGASPDEWRTVFESRPCRDLPPQPDGRLGVTLGSAGGLAFAGPDRFLVSVGVFSGEGTLAADIDLGDLGNSYGKTNLVDLATGESRVYTLGHRNPQGLAAGPDGRIWQTEHGPRGGDELNLLRDGGNYGYPNVTYGTAYDMMTWPGNPVQGRHDGYDKPVFGWVPGIGTSQLLVVESPDYPLWQGDVLVSTLKDMALYRVRIEGDRALFAEPIPVGHRIRDVVEAPDGSIAMKTEDDLVLFLENLDAASADLSTLSPAERGAMLGSQCQGCHALTASGSSGIGPSLWGVVGRPVASQAEYAYSPALRALGGDWTSARLRAFLIDPAAVAPGTSMQTGTRPTESQVSDLVAYLETLR